MELTQDKIDLIGRIIKSDRKYSSNEDLYEDFLNETCKRSMTIINAVENEATLEAYLKRVAATAIINVLKDSGRLRRTKSGYMSTKEIVFDNHKTEGSVSNNVKIEEKIDYSTYNISYNNIEIPESPEDVAIQKEVLDFVANTIVEIDKLEPEENFLNIYTLRYSKGMTQTEIAQELGISQSEVSKRIYKLIKKVKNVLEQ